MTDEDKVQVKPHTRKKPAKPSKNEPLAPNYAEGVDPQSRPGVEIVGGAPRPEGGGPTIVKR